MGGGGAWTPPFSSDIICEQPPNIPKTNSEIHFNVLLLFNSVDKVFLKVQNRFVRIFPSFEDLNKF